jgi:hypothetical protein
MTKGKVPNEANVKWYGLCGAVDDEGKSAERSQCEMVWVMRRIVPSTDSA